MQELEPPDSFFASAAIGWLELGNPREASMDLGKVSEKNREHPGVLEVQWRICAASRNWPEALAVARKQLLSAPDHPAGWINQSYSLHELKRTQEALEVLSPVANKFPSLGLIHYNLACYACQLGQEDAAKKSLSLAIKLKSKDEIKQMALHDSDLKPMWDYIRTL